MLLEGQSREVTVQRGPSEKQKGGGFYVLPAPQLWRERVQLCSDYAYHMGLVCDGHNI